MIYIVKGLTIVAALFKHNSSFTSLSFSVPCVVLCQDPDALAELMKSVPLTSDGKFLLLESETGEAANGEGEDDLESEA